MARKYAAEFLGTALLVLFGAGAATLVFGFRIFGSSLASGILAVAVAFGLILTLLVYVIGPISGCHVNPAVTLGAFLTKRIPIMQLAGYWVAQLAGAVAGAALLLWMLHASPFYSKSRNGLGANGWGPNSLLHIGAAGAFLVEVVLTAVFVYAVLSFTRKGASVPVQGVGIGVSLAIVNLMGIAFDGASVNPARSFGPAILSGGLPLSQLWLFLVAPLVGAVLAAGVHLLFHPLPDAAGGGTRTEQEVAYAAADEQLRPAGHVTSTSAGRVSEATPGRRTVAGSSATGTSATGTSATGTSGTASLPDDPGAGPLR
jgi:aquaporin Z